MNKPRDWNHISTTKNPKSKRSLTSPVHDKSSSEAIQDNKNIQSDAVPYDNAYDDANFDEDTDDDSLSDEAHAQLQFNTRMNDATNPTEYNVQKRLQEANVEFKKQKAQISNNEKKETKVNFKSKLVDLEVPPSSSEDEKEANDVTNGIDDINLNAPPNTVEISGQFLRKDEKVLVEIGGRFHVIEAGDLQKNISLQEKKARPSTADVSRGDRSIKKPQPRSSSATTSPSNQLNNNHRPSNYSIAKATPTFAYPEDTKKIIKKQLALKAKQKAEDEKRKKEEEKLAREEAEEAWKSWMFKKNEEIRRRKKREEKERLKKEEENRKDPEEIDEAYRSWMKQKVTQIKKERIMTQQQQIELDEGWYLRERRDCNRAFRIWLRNKNEAARKAKQEEVKLRKRSVQEMRRAKKAQKLMEKIREAQQMKYVDYYGYRI